MHVPLGREDWYLCRWLDAADEGDREFRGDQASALQFLCQFRADRFAINRLRKEIPRTIAEPLSDDELLRYVSWELSSGRWRARLRARLWTGGATGPGEQVASQPAVPFPLAAKASGPAPGGGPQVRDSPVFPDDIDAAAIASGMKIAAALGVPFCEECARAAAAAARGQ